MGKIWGTPKKLGENSRRFRPKKTVTPPRTAHTTQTSQQRHNTSLFFFFSTNLPPNWTVDRITSGDLISNLTDVDDFRRVEFKSNVAQSKVPVQRSFVCCLTFDAADKTTRRTQFWSGAEHQLQCQGFFAPATCYWAPYPSKAHLQDWDFLRLRWSPQKLSRPLMLKHLHLRRGLRP